jgi:hypothetical protein
MTPRPSVTRVFLLISALGLLGAARTESPETELLVQLRGLHAASCAGKRADAWCDDLGAFNRGTTLAGFEGDAFAITEELVGGSFLVLSLVKANEGVTASLFPVAPTTPAETKQVQDFLREYPLGKTSSNSDIHMFIGKELAARTRLPVKVSANCATFRDPTEPKAFVLLRQNGKYVYGVRFDGSIGVAPTVSRFVRPPTAR